MTDYADLEKRVREMASAWKRWGADGVFKGSLHSDIVNEAAEALASLTRELEAREGFVLMPIEPTEAMIVAGAMNVPALKGTSVAREFAKERYAAMIAARPRLSRARPGQDDALLSAASGNEDV